MRTVGLKVLKNKLSEYVRIASQGERVLIADRDRVVAELVPPEPGRAEGASDAVLAVDRFAAPWQAATLVVMTTYVAAQWLIVQSMREGAARA